uniref:Late embryogenesis abundant protein LEA-2 subgroup domain-containing protein n=3 Tax=Setaria TaxID=4554 RepID=K3XQ59_SETIT
AYKFIENQFCKPNTVHGVTFGGCVVPSILSPHHIHIGLSDPSSRRNSFTSTSSCVAPTRRSRAMRSSTSSGRPAPSPADATNRTILFNGFFILLTMLPSMESIANPDEKPTTCSVELAGFEGLQPALSPRVTSPAFDLILRVNNGHTFCLRHGGGDVVVSYAGVPLAHGRAPSFELGDKEVLALPVKATSAGVGIPGDLSRLMADERRWGVAQIQVEFGLAWESFVCDVELDGHPRVSECYKPTSVN